MSSAGPVGSGGAGAAQRVTCGPAEVLSNRAVAHDLFSLWLALPADWGPPRPGQFVSLTPEPGCRDDLPGDAGATLLRRPFGISAFIAEGHRARVELLYAAPGKVTQRMTALAPGDAIDLLGPLGTDFPLTGPGAAVLVAGGRGIGPLLFLARSLEGRGSCHLLYGTRSAAEMMALPDLPGVRVSLATDDGSRGERASAVELLARLETPAAFVCACGPHGMLAGVAAVARARGWPCWVAVEEIFGCGLGLCGSCAIPATGAADDYGRFLWACREGPVMPAERIAWDRWALRGRGEGR